VREKETVSDSTWNENGVETGELIRDEIVVGDPTLIAEVLGIRASMESSNGNNKAEPIRRGDFAATPLVHKRNLVVLSDKASIRFH
jgi:hypothetical protein